MSAAEASAERDTITLIVREAWEANAGDMPAACEALFAAITSDQVMLNSILPQIVKTWCRDQVGDYVGRIRLAAIKPVADPSRGSRLRTAIVTTLFDFPLPGGKRLGDCNAQEIRDGASKYQETASDAAHKARWLTLVADKVGRKNRAENALTLPQLEQLFEDARHAE